MSKSFPAVGKLLNVLKPSDTSKFAKELWHKQHTVYQIHVMHGIAVPHRHGNRPDHNSQEKDAQFSVDTPWKRCTFDSFLTHLTRFQAKCGQLLPDKTASFAERSQCLFTQLRASCQRYPRLLRCKSSMPRKRLPRRSTVCASWSSSAKASALL